MKRWKYSAANLFQGRYGLVFGPLLCLPVSVVEIILICGLLSGEPHADAALPLMLGFILVLLLIIWSICFLVLHVKTAEERELIANAEPVRWFPISQRDLRYLRSQTSGIRFGVIFVTAMITLSLGFEFLGTGPSRTLLLAGGFLYGLEAVGFLIYYLSWRFWHNTDESAEVAELRVDHCFTRTHTGRGGKYTDCYQVCYLPDGRFVFKAGIGKLRHIRIVRFRGKMRLLPEQNQLR